jgi:hypothetical protein
VRTIKNLIVARTPHLPGISCIDRLDCACSLGAAIATVHGPIIDRHRPTACVTTIASTNWACSFLPSFERRIEYRDKDGTGTSR